MMTQNLYLTQKQREAYKVFEANTISVYGGGIRSGKSYLLLIYFLILCFKYPKSRWLIMRESMPTIKRNLFPTFNKLLDFGFSQYVKQWNKETQTVTFHNGSQILFMAESFDEDKELNRFRGLEINGAGIDEINECQEKTFYKLIERAGSWTGAGKVPIKIIGTCNPSHSWVKELIYDKWRDGMLKPGWAYIPALITDNPYIEKEYLDSLIDNMPDYEYEIFVKGNWDLKLEGVLFGHGDLKRFKLADLKIGEAEATLAYIDVADQGNDSFAMAVAKIYPGKVFITDVIFSKEGIATTLPRAAALIKKAGINYTRVETNNQGQQFIDRLRELAGGIIPVTNSQNKHTRILMAAGFIQDYFHFLHESEYEKGSEYDLFMKEMFKYMKAKEDNLHIPDDAIDSLSGLALLIENSPGTKDLFK
jgi:predicted phage terminase large subunit-like protein